MSDDEENDCPLCLLPLEPYDDAHPLQCPSRHCNFNCCMGCLENMIKSTKEEKIEASDGNTFRVFLHCPNCRSNLGPSIRDTVLLRKVDKYSKQTHVGDGTEVGDAELSASELRFRYALEKDEDVASAIEAAQHREDEFFGRDREEADDTVDFPDVAAGGESLKGSVGESVWSFDDEEGVEADLLGPHKSFVFRHHSIEALNKLEDEQTELEDVPIDTTLLSGLEGFMTEQEQQYMTEELVSGDPQRIAAATEAMHYVSALSREGMRPSMNRQRSSANIGKDKRSRLTKKSSMMESVRQIIREGSEARKREEEQEARKAVGAVAAQLNEAPPLGERVADGRRTNHRMMEIEMKRQMEYMKLHPLPLRMPKYAEVSSNARGLTFVDDTWDGTVLDAYAKITVKKSLLGNVTVTKQHAESMGIRRVIDAGSPASPRSDGRGIIDTVPRPRVLVASINRELGRQGVVKGDAVTHFNGQPFTGDASDLSALIGEKCGGEVLTFVVNADNAVAEALRRRAMIVDDNF